MAEKAILFDATLCTACRGCQAACKQWNENDPYPTEWGTRINGDPSLAHNTGSYENPPDLAPNTWVKMEFRKSNPAGATAWYFTRRACRHCRRRAACRSAPAAL